MGSMIYSVGCPFVGTLTASCYWLVQNVKIFTNDKFRDQHLHIIL